jgi:hypothetical protein
VPDSLLLHDWDMDLFQNVPSASAEISSVNDASVLDYNLLDQFVSAK